MKPFVEIASCCLRIEDALKTHSLAGSMLPFVYRMEFYEKLFEENVDEISLFCMIVSLRCVAFADVLPTAIVMATKEGSACLLQ